MLVPAGAGASGDIVEKITVRVTASEPPPARIAKRMTTSVQTVGEQMLLGKDAQEIIRAKTSYEKLVKEIFDRVLVGYTVQSVNIVPGAVTAIEVEIVPWGDVVREIAVEVDISNVRPEIKELIRKDIGRLEDKISDVLIGLPVDAVDWAGGLSKLAIREMLTVQLPEFRANVEIISGARAVVKVDLVPAGAMIQDVHVSLRSKTIPNLLLTTVRSTVDQLGNHLVGLPVAFVERHRDYFTERLATETAQHSLVKKYGMKLVPAINSGVETEVVLLVEAEQYKVSLEGNMDMGRNKDNTSFKLHVGKFVERQDEVFMEVYFIPGNVSWDFIAGWGHYINKGTSLGLKYNLSEQQGIMWLNQELNRNMLIRVERMPERGRNEFALRYKLHDFISAEYIFTRGNKWLRLIGNL